MIKVLHIINDLKMGGVSSVLYNLLSNTKGNEFDYEIVNLSGVEEQSMIDLFSGLQIKIHNLNYSFEEGYTLKDYFKKAYFRGNYRQRNKGLVDFISSRDPQILHFHTLPRELLLGKMVLKKKPVSLMFTDHTMRVNSSELRLLSKLMIRFPFREFYRGYFVIAVSNAVSDYIKEQKIVSCLRGLKVINNRIPNNPNRIQYHNKSNLNIVYVSRITPAKGQLDLINAWALLPKLNCKLFIVGPDEMNGAVHEFVKRSNCLNEIEFTGPITNVGEFLAEMDIGVFPSHKEGLPIALLEMMQVGLPCVVSDIDEIRAIVTDMYNGLYFKCGNVQELKEKILEMIRNEKLREEIGVFAASTIEKSYSETTTSLIDEYENVYLNLLK